VRNHVLPDGNKRAAGFMCMVEFIEANGSSWPTPEGGDDEVVETIIRLSAGEIPERDFVEWVRERITEGR
jgi:prophage maintenance system killer protein